MAEDAAQATIKELRRELALAREALVDLRWENRQLEAGAEGVVSLDGLRVAWETAEVPTGDTPIREGDVCIELCADHHFEVFRAAVGVEADGRWEPAVRILSRAPGREPWADLADLLLSEGVLYYRADADDCAKALHELGVRVTVGDGNG